MSQWIDIAEAAERIGSARVLEKPTALAVLRGCLHPGKQELVKNAVRSAHLVVLVVDDEFNGNLSTVAPLSLIVRTDLEASPGAANSRERRLCALLNPAYLLMGEKDFPRLVGLAGLKTALIRVPTVRDADGIPWSSFSAALSAEERFQAMYVPRTLTKAKEIAERMNAGRAEIVEKSIENLEKAGDIRVKRCEFLDSRLCVEVDIGRFVIRDNIELPVGHE